MAGAGEKYCALTEVKELGSLTFATEMLQVAWECREAARRVIADRLDKPRTVQFKTSSADLVTEVDRAVEEAIIGVLSRCCPEHGVLGEEGLAGKGDRGQDVVWILDPIDGTTNFVHEGVNYCVSIACYQGDEGVAALIYDPTREETFSAARGLGAWLNERPMRVAEARTLEEAVVHTNLFWDHKERRFNVIPQVKEVAKRCRGLRSLGAGALELAYVAAGRAAAFAGLQQNPWDMAAGALLVKEAGGVVTHLSGRPLRPRRGGSVLASNGLIHEELVRLMAAGPELDRLE